VAQEEAHSSRFPIGSRERSPHCREAPFPPSHTIVASATELPPLIAIAFPRIPWSLRDANPNLIQT
jgi:hypothetical protein